VSGPNTVMGDHTNCEQLLSRLHDKVLRLTDVIQVSPATLVSPRQAPLAEVEKE